ncbi:MAG: phosphatase PAP2 family protein [Bacteroidia bacterium]|nr:phosphatase PAP2 family protein [Bacteroidia bacterium]
MIKVSALSLIFICLFFQGYSQSDSLPAVARDTIAKDSASLSPLRDNEPKVVPNKREQVYKLNLGVDIPIIAVGTAFTLYATTKIYTKGESTREQIEALNISDLNSFDRWAVYPYSKSLDENSYYPFYAAFPLPFVAFLLKDDTRHDFWKLSFLYWEALSITGLFGAGGPFFIDSYRPYAYDTTGETSMEQRQVQNAKNSAWSGHVEVVAASTFFIAKVYGDYYPDTKLLMYSLATVATGSMAYARLMAGMHFPSELIIGTAIGTLSGILVPHFHKHRLIKNPSMSIIPYSTGDIYGLALTYKFKK